MTKLADLPPIWCASCFQQPEGRYVDFEAAYDGPVLEGVPGRPQIDDLVLCEQCMSEGAFVLGWETDNTKAERAREQAAIERLEMEKAALVDYSRKLEETLERGRLAGRQKPAAGPRPKKPELV